MLLELVAAGVDAPLEGDAVSLLNDVRGFVRGREQIRGPGEGDPIRRGERCASEPAGRAPCRGPRERPDMRKLVTTETRLNLVEKRQPRTWPLRPLCGNLDRGLLGWRGIRRPGRVSCLRFGHRHRRWCPSRDIVSTIDSRHAGRAGDRGPRLGRHVTLDTHAGLAAAGLDAGRNRVQRHRAAATEVRREPREPAGAAGVKTRGLLEPSRGGDVVALRAQQADLFEVSVQAANDQLDAVTRVAGERLRPRRRSAFDQRPLSRPAG